MVWRMGTYIWRNQHPVSCSVAFYHKHGGSAIFQTFVPIYQSARCHNPNIFTAVRIDISHIFVM